jgi:hypothetical protein
VEEGPSGAAYKDEAAQKRADKRAEKAQIQAQQDAEDAADAEKRFGEVGSDEEEGADDDNELRQLRVRRMKEMKRRAEQKLEHIGKGHGQLRDILEDEFLKEVTGSDRVICHFYHGDFPRCAIMDMHLLKLAKRHIETKFIKVPPPPPHPALAPVMFRYTRSNFCLPPHAHCRLTQPRRPSS